MFNKFLTLFLGTFIVLFFYSVSFGQATLFYDGFESYAAGTGLACQNPVDWDTWGNAPCSGEDPLVSSNFAAMGVNSFVVALPTNDLIYRFGDLASGKYTIHFYIYIPAGKSGYFNVMQNFDAGFFWATEIYFDAGGTGRQLTGNPDVPFTWLEDVWQDVNIIIDLDNDLAEFWFAGSMVQAWTYTNASSGTGTTTLAVNDFFGATANDEMYVDEYTFTDKLIPVELTSFAANVNNEGQVNLNWSTASELNNQMFEIERRSEESQFVTIGFVEGYGTTTETQEYSYLDRTVTTGTYFYRLKQIDFDGRNEYSDEVEVEVLGPLAFGLDQNYPNPFNPSTTIKYSIASSGYVKLAVYTMIGEEVSVLVDGQVESGFYEVNFDASNLPSGAYFYRLTSDNSVEIKKMLLMK